MRCTSDYEKAVPAPDTRMVKLRAQSTLFSVNPEIFMRYPYSMLGKMFSDQNASLLQPDNAGEFFFDIDPVIFEKVIYMYEDGYAVPLDTDADANSTNSFFDILEYFGLGYSQYVHAKTLNLFRDIKKKMDAFRLFLTLLFSEVVDKGYTFLALSISQQLQCAQLSLSDKQKKIVLEVAQLIYTHQPIFDYVNSCSYFSLGLNENGTEAMLAICCCCESSNHISEKYERKLVKNPNSEDSYTLFNAMLEEEARKSSVLLKIPEIIESSGNNYK